MNHPINEQSHVLEIGRDQVADIRIMNGSKVTAIELDQESTNHLAKPTARMENCK